MGTVKTCCDISRLKIRDVNNLQFVDNDLIMIINEIIVSVNDHLINMLSNLVYSVKTQSVIDGTSEYTPTFEFNSFVRNATWIDLDDGGADFLTEISEHDKNKVEISSDATDQPVFFYVTPSGDIGYLPTPDDSYTINHTVWVNQTVLSVDDIATDDLPFNGIFNQYISDRLTVNLLEILERDNSRAAVFAEISFNKALMLVYSRGLKQERVSSNLFSY